MVDIVLSSARKAKMEYSHAMHFQKLKSSHWIPTVHMISAIEGKGIDEILLDIDKAHDILITKEELQSKRRRQAKSIVKRKFENRVSELAFKNEAVKGAMDGIIDRVASGEISSHKAAESLARLIFTT